MGINSSGWRGATGNMVHVIGIGIVPASVVTEANLGESSLDMGFVCQLSHQQITAYAGS